MLLSVQCYATEKNRIVLILFNTIELPEVNIASSALNIFAILKAAIHSSMRGVECFSFTNIFRNSDEL